MVRWCILTNRRAKGGIYRMRVFLDLGCYCSQNKKADNSDSCRTQTVLNHVIMSSSDFEQIMLNSARVRVNVMVVQKTLSVGCSSYLCMQMHGLQRHYLTLQLWILAKLDLNTELIIFIKFHCKHFRNATSLSCIYTNFTCIFFKPD